LKIAEEKLMPDEETYLDSIIASFEKQMCGLWKPGRFERGRKYKDSRHRAREFIVHQGLPPELRHASMREDDPQGQSSLTRGCRHKASMRRLSRRVSQTQV
jgi:hypothetical protein